MSSNPRIGPLGTLSPSDGTVTLDREIGFSKLRALWAPKLLKKAHPFVHVVSADTS